MGEKLLSTTRKEKPRFRVGQLKRKYPHPVRAKDANPWENDSYCVGGAICIEAGIDRAFPDDEQVREAFTNVNPYLDVHLNDQQYEYFREQTNLLLRLNDLGDFKHAWQVLGKLLRWNPARERGDRRKGNGR